MATEKYLEAFDVIRLYAEKHKWIPIGLRRFSVGPWNIFVNGTRETNDNVPPYHAAITHDKYLGAMVISPLAGNAMGWRDIEADFVRDMRAALEAPKESPDA